MNGYAYSIQADDGFDLTTGERWRGWRVRYRKDGTRLWRSFLLTMDDDSRPTDEQVEQAIRFHEAGDGKR